MSEDSVALDIIPNSDGKTMRATPRGKNGRFLTKPRPEVDPRELKRVGREFLNQKPLVIGPDGKMTRDSKSRFVNILERNYKVAMGQCQDETPGHLMASVKAANDFIQNFIGKPATAVEDRDVLETQQIRVVVLTAPEGIKPMEPEKLAPKPIAPSFIEGEVVE